MIVKSPYILAQLIDYRRQFVQLAGYVEDHDGDTEIPIRLYRRLVREAAEQHVQSVSSPSPERERQRLLHTLNEENLLGERLIIRLDKNRGTMVLAPFVLDMLRHFDVGRMSGLSLTELEDLREGLNRSLTSLQQLTFDLTNDDFREELRLLRRRIQSTLGKMQESVAALAAQGNRLGDIVERQDFGSLEGAARTRSALEHINRIYQRHILPALQFLDPGARFTNGLPAAAAIRRIAELATANELHAINEELLLSANAIQSYVKDIDALRQSLERFVRQNRRQRLEYEQIERAFNRLREATEDTHDPNMRNKYIPLHDPSIQNPGTFVGIKRMRFPRFDWFDIDHKADIEEFTDRRIAELREVRDQAGAVAVDPSRAGLSTEEIREQRHQETLQALLKTWQIPFGCEDLHAALHAHLSARLDGYVLTDLLDALDWVMALPDLRYRARFQHHEIVHGELALSYHPLTLAHLKEPT